MYPVLLLVILDILKLTQVIAGPVHCGSPVTDLTDTRVIGGKAAPLGAWPWTVLLSEVNIPICGGAIVSDRILVTAAHCFEDDLSKDPSRWTVSAGGVRLDRFENSKRTYHVNKILMHPDYNTGTVENDIALVYLKNTIKFSNYIRPICLPAENAGLAEGTVCYLAGYGDTRGTADSKGLNQVTLPVIANEKCSNETWYGSYFHPNSSFCAGYAEGGVDACTGDSGSPLVCKLNSKWSIYGISSWGYGCAEPKWPGIYTKVSQYSNWIQHHINLRSLVVG